MLKKYSFFFTVIVACCLCSCSKEKNMVEATVVDTGDITYDGCGYLLRLNDSALLKPTYMPGAYQHDGMQVKIDYHHTGIKDTCQYGSVIYDMVKLDDIERKN
ncbi:MAG TPA: hypothetical protein VFL76_05810 [Edaphocola sp.]|nr:hypothetical protein [Edaphocola sp.]